LVISHSLSPAARRAFGRAQSPPVVHERTDTPYLHPLKMRLDGKREADPIAARLSAGPLQFRIRVRDFLTHYAEETSQLPSFLGRALEMKHLSAWLDDPASQRLLISSPAGRGKSALITHWLRGWQAGFEIVFMPISMRFGPTIFRPI